MSFNKRAGEPGHAYLFSMPPVDALNLAELIADCGGVESVAKRFELTPELVRLWLEGRVLSPKYFRIALWWQSWRGFDQGFSETHYANARNYRELCRAEKRVELLEQVVRRALERLGDDGAYLGRIAFSDTVQISSK